MGILKVRGEAEVHPEGIIVSLFLLYRFIRR